MRMVLYRMEIWGGGDGRAKSLFFYHEKRGLGGVTVWLSLAWML